MKRTVLLSGFLMGASLISYAQGNGNGNNGNGGQKWSVSGNSVNSGDYIGTDNAESLVFKANGSEGFRLTPSGNLGVGLTNPSEKLQVAGMISSTLGGYMFPDGSIQSTAYTQPTGGSFYEADQYLKVGVNSMFLTGPLAPTTVGGTGEHEIFVTNDDLFIQSNSASGNFNTIINAGSNKGNVGIGKTVPTAKLDLQLPSVNFAEAGIRITAPAFFTASQTNPLLIPSPSLFHIRRAPVFGGTFTTHFQVAANGNTAIGDDVQNDIKLYVLNHQKDVGLCVNNAQNSNHGYGIISRVDNPTTKALAVIDDNDDNDVFRVMGDGHVWCTELNVDVRGDFPDYVFKDDYNLMTLKDLEQYIESYGHLPNMPSAEEVKVEGIAVSEISVTHTEKIEELTLYILEINKSLEAMKEENKALQQRVHELESK